MKKDQSKSLLYNIYTVVIFTCTCKLYQCHVLKQKKNHIHLRNISPTPASLDYHRSSKLVNQVPHLDMYTGVYRDLYKGT